MKNPINKIVLKFLFAIILPLFVFTGCGDDEPDNDNKSIVGSWTCENHYYGGSDTFTFKKNGTMSWTYKGSWSFTDYTGSYTFNGSILTVTNTKGTTWIYIVAGLSDTTLVMIDEDGDSYTYHKK